MVDVGSGQGRNDVETGGGAALRRGFQQSENAGLGRKMPFTAGYYLIFTHNSLTVSLPVFFH
jgi:hypothetical protein